MLQTSRQSQHALPIRMLTMLPPNDVAGMPWSCRTRFPFLPPLHFNFPFVCILLEYTWNGLLIRILWQCLLLVFWIGERFYSRLAYSYLRYHCSWSGIWWAHVRCFGYHGIMDSMLKESFCIVCQPIAPSGLAELLGKITSRDNYIVLMVYAISGMMIVRSYFRYLMNEPYTDNVFFHPHG